MKGYIQLIAIILALFCYSKLLGQWLDKQSIQSTVLIEKIGSDGSFIPYGTGFILYNYDTTSNNLIIVTCAHLLKDKQKLCVRMNPDTSIIKTLSLGKNTGALVVNTVITNNSIRIIAELNPNTLYVHPELDIAAFYISIPQPYQIIKGSIKPLKLVNLLAIPKSSVKYRKQLSLSDEVYFVGFPLGYGVTESIEPIIRSGSIAWLPKEQPVYMLDAFSFGGNSGSPIFLKQIVGAKLGELSWNNSNIVGMIVGHQSITVNNVLNQPNPSELKFEIADLELNIGLARCVFMDDIMFTVEQLQKKK